MDDVELRVDGDAVILRVRVAPRASREAIAGVHDGALKVSLTAPPVEGAANAALVKLLAKRLGVPRRDVAILRGESGRDKTLRVVGTTPDAIRALARG